MKGFARRTLALLLMGAGACASAPPPPPTSGEPNSFLLRDVRLFDGERVQERTDVLVRGGRVAAVGRGAGQATGVEVIDGTGKTLLPGLIDSHVHVFPGAQADALRFGVTAEIDMFSMGGSQAAAAYRAQRESLAPTPQADTWVAGIGVTPPGGHPTGLAKGMGVDLPTLAPGADADAFVRARVAEGSDHIKIFQDEGRLLTRKLAAFPPETLAAVIAAAQRQGKRAVVHVSDEAAAIQAAEAGADALAHIFEDRPASPRFVSLAKARGLVVIPTLSVIVGLAGPTDANAVAGDPVLRPWLSPMQAGMLGSGMNKLRPEAVSNAIESTRRLHAAGVPILAGTDAPNPGTAHGPSVHGEMALLVRAGMTPLEALRSATSRPADAFGLADRGRVRAGTRADLVLVDGDPSRDITATRRISRIWKNGYSVDRTIPPDPRGPPPTR
jgi:imidazolonepropionase-like amidohydrolase